MKNIDIEASNLVLGLESIGLYGLGYFAGLLVERGTGAHSYGAAGTVWFRD